MDYEDTVEPQEEQVAEQVIDQMQQDVAEEAPAQAKEHEEKVVPLSALQKMRKRAQEAELKAQWLEQQQQRYQQPQAPVEEDTSKYESATREDLSRAQEESIRVIEERLWIKQNPEKFEKVNEYLPQFLKQRPNLASAINSASNRYEEAYELMDKLTPKQQQQIKPISTPKKEAPNAPGGVPKAAALNQAVDVMSMSDSEFNAWRQAQKKRR
jgi:hypothetical protein